MVSGGPLPAEVREPMHGVGVVVMEVAFLSPVQSGVHGCRAGLSHWENPGILSPPHRH